jgi:hypothetical protein
MYLEAWKWKLGVLSACTRAPYYSCYDQSLFPYTEFLYLLLLMIPVRVLREAGQCQAINSVPSGLCHSSASMSLVCVLGKPSAQRSVIVYIIIINNNLFFIYILSIIRIYSTLTVAIYHFCNNNLPATCSLTSIINHLTQELNPSAQRCLTRFFYWGFGFLNRAFL